MNIKFATLEYVLILVAYILVIFTHLKLWVAVARYNFKWVKIAIVQLTFIV